MSFIPLARKLVSMGSKVKNMVIDRVSMEVYAVSGELGEWPRCGTHSEALSTEYD